MYLAQVFCKVPYRKTAMIFSFEFHPTNWVKQFPEMHTTLGNRG